MTPNPTTSTDHWKASYHTLFSSFFFFFFQSRHTDSVSCRSGVVVSVTSGMTPNPTTSTDHWKASYHTLFSFFFFFFFFFFFQSRHTDSVSCRSGVVVSVTSGMTPSPTTSTDTLPGTTESYHTLFFLVFLSFFLSFFFFFFSKSGIQTACMSCKSGVVVSVTSGMTPQQQPQRTRVQVPLESYHTLFFLVFFFFFFSKAGIQTACPAKVALGLALPAG